jgi:hypothetical protein
MRKFWRGFRQASDLREREENAKIKKEQLEKLRALIYGGGGAADEHEFIVAVKAWKPGITEQELREYIKRFRNAVSGEQEHDQ